MSRRHTIAAIATAPGRAGIGIVRVSGGGAGAIAERITGRALLPRRATLSPFRDAAGTALDHGIALLFPGPQSYTGEDVLELQGHGGPVVLRLVLQRCLELGARAAEPGEFTQRAFLNGKLDLVQAESVIDLIDASTAEAARGAMRSLMGEFSTRIQALNAQLVELRALVEATLDFPEEEIDGLDRTQARGRLERLRAQLDSVLEIAHQGSLLRDGLHVVLAGAPNVGKSSLLNRLAGEELAIVTDVPGTTRDPIRQAIDLDGIPAHVVDTAGLRDALDPIERIGVARAWNAIEAADVVVLVVEAAGDVAAGSDEILTRIPATVPRIQVVNKIDLTGEHPSVSREDTQTVVRLSAKTGAGVDLLRQALLNVAGWHGQREGVFIARERHLAALAGAGRHLENASAQRAPELMAEELRLAHERMAAITGEFAADDLLGVIFERFCIGK